MFFKTIGDISIACVSPSQFLGLLILTLFKVLGILLFRPPDKIAYEEMIFHISQPKHMLWVI